MIVKPCVGAYKHTPLHTYMYIVYMYMYVYSYMYTHHIHVHAGLYRQHQGDMCEVGAW